MKQNLLFRTMTLALALAVVPNMTNEVQASDCMGGGTVQTFIKTIEMRSYRFNELMVNPFNELMLNSFSEFNMEIK